MSTRANIVIKKKENNKIVYNQFYHHYDGYPDGGVGENLVTAFKDLFPEEWSLNKAAAIVMDIDNGYENEGFELRLHADIEYLYVIDLDKRSIVCYSLWIWDSPFSDESIVNGKVADCQCCNKCFDVEIGVPFDDVNINC